MIRFIGFFAFIISQFLAIALPALERQDSLADLFAMDRRDMITAPEHLGIINGKLTIGTPGGQAARIDGLWAPPFVSSDFALRVEVFGKEVPTPACKWWPFKLEQRGEVNGVEVSAATVLAPGRRGGLVAITLHNTTSNALEAPAGRSRPAARSITAGSGNSPRPQARPPPTPIAENSTLTLTAGERSIVLRRRRRRPDVGRRATGSARRP